MKSNENTILAVCGSPRKGNTYSVLNSVKDYYPNIDYKILMLKDMNLEDCRGCYVCINLGGDKCPLKDDRDMIIREMSDADGIVFASPTHTRHVSALMKKFMDRLGYIAHRPYFFDKYAIVMATCAGFGADLANNYMNETFYQCGFNVVSSLELPIAIKSETEKKFNHEKTIKAFDTLIVSINNREEHKPTLNQLVYFNIFKGLSEINKNKNKADYEFYKDKTNYYFDTKINPFKNMMAKWVAGKEIKKMMANR